MNAEERFDWEEEDELFQAEFLEISSIYRASQNMPPKVPSKLSRLIRQQAKNSPVDDLAKNWIFSKAMMLLLAVLTLFSVGLVFVFAADANSDQKINPNPNKVGQHLKQ